MGGDVGHAKSIDLTPGTRLRGPDGETSTLGCRRDRNYLPNSLPPSTWHPGWLLVEGGGLADFVIDDPEYGWEVIEPDDIEVEGWKVYATREGDWIVMGCVNDDRPLVRMTFRLGVEDAEDIVTLLREAIDRAE